MPCLYCYKYTVAFVVLEVPLLFETDEVGCENVQFVDNGSQSGFGDVGEKHGNINVGDLF